MELWKIKNRLRLYKINLTESAKSILVNKHTDYNTIGDYILNLGDNVWVSVNVSEESDYILDYQNDCFTILKNGVTIVKNVKVYQASTILKQQFTNFYGENVYVGDYIAQHGSRIRWMPNFKGYACSNDCKFCEVWANKNINPKEPEDFKKAFEIVWENSKEKITELLVSGGTPRNDKESYEYMNKIYKQASNIAKENCLNLDIMFAPRGYYSDTEAELRNISKEENYKLFFQFLKELKVTDLAINIELWNERYRKQLISKKNKFSREEYVNYMKIGIGILGEDIIRSCIIIGLEPIEDTLIVTEELAKHKIRIIYSPYEPYLFESDNSKLDYKRRLVDLDEDIKERVIKFNLTIDEEDYLTETGYSICKKYGAGFGSKYPSSNHNCLSI